MLRHFVPHFSPNSGGIACWVREFCFKMQLNKLKYKWLFKDTFFICIIINNYLLLTFTYILNIWLNFLVMFFNIFFINFLLKTIFCDYIRSNILYYGFKGNKYQIFYFRKHHLIFLWLEFLSIYTLASVSTKFKMYSDIIML